MLCVSARLYYSTMNEISLHNVRKEILDSMASGWNRVNGPTFRTSFEWGSDGVTAAPTHHNRAVLMRDIRIALEWGFDAWGSERSDRESYAEPWVTDRFPDPSANLIYADVLFNGTVIDRVSLITVDGGRAYIPQPSVVSKGDGEYGYQIDHWGYHFAMLINEFDLSIESFEQYFVRTEIEKDF